MNFTIKGIISILLFLSLSNVYALKVQEKLLCQDLTDLFPKLENYASYQIQSIDSKQFRQILNDQKQVVLVSDLGEIPLQLNPFPLRDAQTIIRLDDQRISGLSVNTFQGYVDADGGGTASFTVTDGFIFGYYKVGNESFFIEPYKNEQNLDLYLFYNVADFIDTQNHSCGFDLVQLSLNQKVEETKGGNFNFKNGTCKLIEVAVAGDYTYLNKYGSLAGAVNQSEAVINAMVGLYADEFSNDYSFYIPVHHYSSYSGTWTSSTSACVLLDDFYQWGQDGGFGSTPYDLAQLWTTRDIQNNTGCTPAPANPGNAIVGLAYLPSICTNFSYLVLEDNNTLNAVLRRNLNAHEITHTLGAEYHVSNSIMSSSLGPYENWSSTTLSEVNDHLTNGSPQYNQAAPDCLSACTNSCSLGAGTLSTTGSLSITTSQSTTFNVTGFSASYYAYIITNTATGLIAYYGSTGIVNGATLGAGTYCIQGIAHSGSVSLSVGSLSPLFGGTIASDCYELTNCTSSSTVTITTPVVNVQRMKVKVLLGGFHLNNGLMRTDLRANNLLPYSHPYAVSPYNYGASSSVTSLPSNTVDWVLVELRNKNNENQIIARQVALLRNDGVIMGTDGLEGVPFVNVTSDYYFIVVYHRNHIAVMSNSSIFYPNTSTYNFTTGVIKAKGTQQLILQNGYATMIPGDFDGNIVINNLDYNLWYSASAALNQYLRWDADGNTVVNSLDYNLWYANRSKVGYSSVQF